MEKSIPVSWAPETAGKNVKNQNLLGFVYSFPSVAFEVKFHVYSLKCEGIAHTSLPAAASITFQFVRSASLQHVALDIWIPFN